MNYLLTGATGLIGSHVLFELLRKIETGRQNHKIYLLVRSHEGVSPKERITNLLTDEQTPDYIKAFDLASLLSKLECIESDLSNPELPSLLQNSTPEKLNVIHVAASTNLDPGEKAAQEVFKNNNLGTKNLLKGIVTKPGSKLSFISTAFSCGIQNNIEVLSHNYTQYQKSLFRNPYEANKSEIEDFLQKECRKNNIDLQILRPAVVCGRLMDTPLFHTTKFDVFYGWAKFFYKMKPYLGEEKLRIAINSEGTLNIIPVDYVAKVIVKANEMEDIDQLNIINTNPPLHQEYIPQILGELGIQNYEFTDSEPEEMSFVENIYYNKSAGKAFGPYIRCKNMVFEASTLVEKFKEIQYGCVNQHFSQLIAYGLEKEFEA